LIQIFTDRTHLIFGRVEVKPKARREKILGGSPLEPNYCSVVYTRLTTMKRTSGRFQYRRGRWCLVTGKTPHASLEERGLLPLIDIFVAWANHIWFKNNILYSLKYQDENTKKSLDVSSKTLLLNVVSSFYYSLKSKIQKSP
jgi:hypothetical protein